MKAVKANVCMSIPLNGCRPRASQNIGNGIVEFASRIVRSRAEQEIHENHAMAFMWGLGNRVVVACGLALACWLFAQPVSAQCTPRWLPSTELGRLDGPVNALKVWDPDGPMGPLDEVLVVGGYFLSAADERVNRIAIWDGASWSPMGTGFDGAVLAIEVFDDGTGPAVYAGGIFIYAGEVAVRGIARWDGQSWVDLEGGVAGQIFPAAIVSDLKSFDDGAGPALFAAGAFATAGNVAARNVARWDGTSWSALGMGMGGPVWSLEVFEDGAGEALFAGGEFVTNDEIAFVARWDGTSWISVGGLGQYAVNDLQVFDDGTGPALFAGAGFPGCDHGSTAILTKWNGTAWTAVSNGPGAVHALTIFDYGIGPQLFYANVCSPHKPRKPPYARISRWDGVSSFDLGFSKEANVSILNVFDDGSGPVLYVGGDFGFVTGITSPYLTRWGCSCPHCDRNRDGRVDSDDFSAFPDCMTGPEILYGPGCENARFDAGRDVDLADFAVFQNEFTGTSS